MYIYICIYTHLYTCMFIHRIIRIWNVNLQNGQLNLPPKLAPKNQPPQLRGSESPPTCGVRPHSPAPTPPRTPSPRHGAERFFRGGDEQSHIINVGTMEMDDFDC